MEAVEKKEVEGKEMESKPHRERVPSLTTEDIFQAERHQMVRTSK